MSLLLAAAVLLASCGRSSNPTRPLTTVRDDHGHDATVPKSGTSPTVAVAAGLTLTPATVVGGSPSRARLAISGTQSTFARVSITSSNTAVAVVPSARFVSPGATSVSFTVTTRTVTTVTSVVISTTLAGVTKRATLTVTPTAIVTPPPPPAVAVTVSSIALAPASVIGGASSQGTVTLSGAAPTGGAGVTLSSANSSVAAVPATVSVAAGSTTGTFTVTTTSVTTATGVAISAASGGVTRSATLTVNPPDPCASVAGLGGTVGVVSATVPQFRPTRLRIDLVGDVPGNWINAMGACSATPTPADTWISGTATVTLAGSNTAVTATGGPLAFGALTFPVPAEAGVVLATDAAGNVLQLIWPALAGLAPGPPTLRLNLAVYGPAAQAGALVDATLTYTVRAPDGTTATFTATGRNMVIPPLKL